MKIKRQHIIWALPFIGLCLLALYFFPAKRNDIEISQIAIDAFCGVSFQISNTTPNSLNTDLLIKTYVTPSDTDAGGLSWFKSVSYRLKPYEKINVNEKMGCMPGVGLPSIADVEVERIKF